MTRSEEMTKRTPTSRWTTTLDDMRNRRAERLAQKAIARDLAGYSTPSQQSEMNAILRRYEGPEAEAFRAIVNRTIAA
jgi:hypothetical protein